jgi:hypothetical protein
MVLAVWWGFFVLKSYYSEGYFNIIQINIIPKYLGDLKAIRNLLLKIGR